MNTRPDTSEYRVCRVDPTWRPSMLLAERGVYALEDVAKTLSIEPAVLKAHADAIRKRGLEPKNVMGIQKEGMGWLIFMETFSSYYLQNLANRIRRIQPGWDANRLLRGKGVFLLRDVCTLIPFNTGQIRYQVSKCRDSRKEIGVWKQQNVGAYLVDMSVFGVWLTSLWMNPCPK